MRWEAAANMKKTQPPSRFCSHVLSLFLVPAAAFSFACFTHATQGTDMCVRACVVVVVVVWGEGSAHWLLVERVLCRYILDRTGMQRNTGRTCQSMVLDAVEVGATLHFSTKRCLEGAPSDGEPCELILECTHTHTDAHVRLYSGQALGTWGVHSAHSSVQAPPVTAVNLHGHAARALASS